MTETDENQLETLLARCLASPPADWPKAIEDACAAHPALAADLRRRWARLDEAGLVEPHDGAGEDFGEFRLLAQLGGGAMGVVHAAWWRPEARLVALKLLRPGRLANEESRRRFRREMETTRALRHPALVEVHTVGEHDGTPYLVMRLVEGETLARRLARPDGVPGDEGAVLETARRFAALARGLDLAHEAGLVHRDVKPANVMITPAGDAVLLDFGLAHRSDSDSSRWTDPTARVGTPAYMSPETIEGAPPDRSADVYALGATLLEALTGQRPFAAPTLEATLRRATTEAAPDPRRVNRAVGRDLSLVVRTALARSPEERYATARDLAADLEAVTRGAPVRARRPGLARATWRWVRDAPRGTVLAFVAILFAGSLAWRWRGVARELELMRGFAAAETPREELRLALGAWNQDWESRSRLQETLARSHASHVIPLDGDAWGMTYRHDGALLVGVDRELHVLDVPFRGSPRLWGNLPWDPESRSDLSWDGRRALVLERDEKQRLGLVEEGGNRTLAEGVLAAELTPLGPLWVVVGEDGALSLGRLDTAGEAETAALFTEHRAWKGAAVAPLTGRILAWDDAGELAAWDAAGLPLGAPVVPGGTPPVGAACAADGSLFITGSEQGVRGAADLAELWTLDEFGARRVARLDDVSPVAWARITDSGEIALALHEDGLLRAWNRRGVTPFLAKRVGPGAGIHLTGPSYVAVAPSRGRLELLTLDGDKVAELPVTGRPLDVLASPRAPDEVAVLGAGGDLEIWRASPSSGHRFSPRHGHLVGAWPLERGVLTLAENGVLTRFALDGSRDTERRLAVGDGKLRGAAYSARLDLLVFGLHTGELRELDVGTGKEVLRHELGAELSAAWELTLGPEGVISACDPEGSVWVDGAAAFACPGPPRALTHAGSRIAAGGRTADGREGWIRVWDDGTPIATLEDLCEPITTLCLSSDGLHLVAGSGQPRVMQWRLEAARKGVLERRPDWTLNEAIHCAAIAPSDDRIAVGCSDGTVEIWELGTSPQRLVEILRGHTQAVREVVFDRDGSYLVSTSWDGSARRWPLTKEELQTLAEELLGDG